MVQDFFRASFATLFILLSQSIAFSQDELPAWNQWRGPERTGVVIGPAWPRSLNEDSLERSWRVELPPSYSGPVLSDRAVFVTGTENKETEVVLALDRNTGAELWRAEWPGSMSVPFFAASNGSWIRATPVYDGSSLYVAGMRDVLVSLDAETGEEQWRVDFVKELGTPVPSFGFASSPLLDGNFLYVQAGASLIKLDKETGEIVWRVLKDDGGMMGSAFSSPTIATLSGKRQLLVQTRLRLAGVDPDSGEVLWEQDVPNFRGMNILTPIPFENGVFTSSYRNKAWYYEISRTDERFNATEKWSNNAQAYMSTPVVIDNHAYLHLQNRRFTCIDLRTGERTWTSEPFGKYCSMVAKKDLILALDERGILLLIRASREKFELLDERKVSDEETWAHVAVSGPDVIVRELNAVSVFQWRKPAPEDTDRN
ncbi:PQQ-binding-like beta-propeller repeat protein [Rubinisphaera margarita]|uniref:PQQ-binding-like beta-propeller repeat protein n=1 Tax=Rubinisphaera margarita TaxID=2909586 RepID=UPI001EE8E8CE|nr:PQQ-binding-like beta-propeller repeat protein [Rubinisphaera margarita]MCG6158139.1 PQQ-like beta-propeller repeat protein [Rubinisphaera margarita]